MRKLQHSGEASTSTNRPATSIAKQSVLLTESSDRQYVGGRPELDLLQLRFVRGSNILHTATEMKDLSRSKLPG